ncbi:hypothetical protein G7046_g1870 [Stylonectria norvegica]|nr:hypothetical protein G7046_g1870 [Stylonectria norvegica]
MSSGKEFKLIIAGGGIAGLTLAILFEKFNIDYVLLEAHDEIAPPIGASIGMMPNGLLILDQLGCYNAARVAAQAGEFDNLHMRSSDGKSMKCTEHMFSHMENRHGYPMIFFDRKWLLQVLYRQIQHKDRVMLQSQVHKIDYQESGVHVLTKDGRKYSGTMIIGADGIHSAVRQEMFRIAGEEQPGYFTAGEEDRVPCYYQCSFGIAYKVANWPRKEQSFTTGDRKAFLVTSGPEDRVYWFLFVKLPEAKYGSEIPKYTEKDESEFVKKHQALPITQSLTFGQLYEKRIASALTPLHEVVFEKWFYKRMLLIGDSAHKPNPIGGMGGNGALESAAEFMNALLQKRDERAEGLSGLTTKEIHAICNKMQRSRHKRATATVDSSHKMQAILAYEKPAVSAIMWTVLTPLVSNDSPLRVLSARIVGGSRVEKLPIPHRPRAIPYVHELPALPIASAQATIVSLGYTALMCLLVWLSFGTQRISSFTTGQWGQPDLTSLESKRTNYTIVDTEGFSFDPLLETDPAFKMRQLYLLSQSISPLLVYTIEGSRVGNKGLPCICFCLFITILHFLGICQAVPLASLLSASLAFDAPAGRFVTPQVARSLVPALTLGYVLPSLLILGLPENVSGSSRWSSIAYLAFPVLMITLPAISRSWSKTKDTDSASYLDRYKSLDVAILRFAYEFTSAIQATIHVAILIYCMQSGILSTAVLEVSRLYGSNESGKGNYSGLLSLFTSNIPVTVLGIVTQNLYSIWDLRRAGFITTWVMAKTMACLTATVIMFGPGAAWAGLWSWRESIISSLSTT